MVGPTSDAATSSAVQTATLTLDKIVDKTAAAPGDLLTYTLTVRNTGNVTLTGLTLVDPAPGAGAFDFTACAALNGSSLAPSQQVSCIADYRVTQADLAAGGVTNTATASATAPVAASAATASAATVMLPAVVVAGLALTGAAIGTAPAIALLAILLGLVFRRRKAPGAHAL